MRATRGVIILVLGAVFGLAGCSDRGLKDLRSNSAGPDEFLVLPVKPLSAPQSYSDLPPPTPGGVNLVDPNPTADAVSALGGRASALNATAIPGSDGALVNATRRYGVSPGIRGTLATADAKFRKRQAVATRFRLFRVDRYEQAYRRQALDPFAETRRFRRSGIGTPASPPEKD